MQIQKGLVKYKDRTDIVCTYGLTDDGKQYYFLDESSIPNGNIIASTALVEAIDPVVVATNVGVIDRDGNIVIPFSNRSIKVIGNGLLLVERANSTTPSVLEAIKLRSDPLAATKLVTTPATIKDNMNAKMGNDGRFVFNDQFSEATICDMNGNNLIDNEYYSFIGIKNNEALYFSKNTISSPVVEFVLPNAGGVEVPLPSENSEKLDIQNTEVTKEKIDGAMTGDITAASFEDMAQPQDTQEVMVDNTIPPDSTLADEVKEATNENPIENTVLDDNNKKINSGFAPEDVALDVPNNQVEVGNNNVSSQMEDSNLTSEENEGNVQEIGKDDSEANAPLQDSSETADSYAPKEEAIELPLNMPTSEDVKEEVNDNPVAQEGLMSFDFKDNINYDSKVGIDTDVEMTKDDKKEEKQLDEVEDFKKDLFDMDLEAEIFADSTLHADKIINDSYDDTSLRLSSKDTIIEDVASTLSNLIKLNKEQKEKIATYETKFEQIVTTHKNVVEKARSQVREMEVLKAKVKNYETIVSKLENKIQNLEDKVHDQDRIINSQTSELEALRPQVEGKRELARILADAQDLLEHTE